jgi:hypothetical protein
MKKTTTLLKQFGLSLMVVMLILALVPAATSPVMAQDEPDPTSTPEPVVVDGEGGEPQEGIPTEDVTPAPEPVLPAVGAGLFGDSERVQPLDVSDPDILRERFVVVDVNMLMNISADGGEMNAQSASNEVVFNFFEDVTLTGVVTDYFQNENKVHVWYGQIDGNDHAPFVMVATSGGFAAHVASEYGTYQVLPVDGQDHIIQQINGEAEANDIVLFPDGVELTPEQIVSGEESVEGLADNGQIVDVMVLYTATARSGAGGTPQIQTQVYLAIEQTNQSFQNSGINTRLRLVHTAEVSYTETGNIYTGLYNLRDVDGQIDHIHNLRNTYGADLVSMIVEKENNGFCGVAWVAPYNESYGFSVVKRSCATSYYSFAHELGHNFGALHDWHVDSGTYPFTYGHGYVDTVGKWRTIMSYPTACSTCTRINYWSNPRVTYNGRRMGVPEGEYRPADNARVINNTAYSVANFRVVLPSTPTLLSPANGATSQNLLPPFDWSDATNATSYTLQVSTSSTFSTYIINQTVSSSAFTPSTNLPNNATLYWRVRGKNASGSSPWSATFVYKTGAPPPAPTSIAPVNGTTDLKIKVLVDWSTITMPAGATFKQYVLQVATNPEFTTGLMTRKITSRTDSQYLFTTGLLYNKTYYWRVKAMDATGKSSDWSPVWQFSTLKPPASPPAKAAPAHNSLFVKSTRVILQWNSLLNATAYEVQFSGPVSGRSGWITTLSYRTPQLPKGIYTWRVRAKNAAGATAWSTTWTIYVHMPPPIPGLNAPASNTQFLPGNVGTSWFAAPIASEYLLEYSGTQAGNSGWRTSTSYILPNLPAGTYNWRVKARNIYGESAWSGWRTFVVVNPQNVTVMPLGAGFSSTFPGGWVYIRTQNTIYCSTDNANLIYTRTRTPPYTNDVDWAKWTPNLPVSGRWGVYVYIPNYTHTMAVTGQARYQVKHANGTTTVVVDQNQSLCSWRKLGTFNFTAGTSGYVYMGDYTGDSVAKLIAADAIRFIYEP